MQWLACPKVLGCDVNILLMGNLLWVCFQKLRFVLTQVVETRYTRNRLTYPHGPSSGCEWSVSGEYCLTRAVWSAELYIVPDFHGSSTASIGVSSLGHLSPYVQLDMIRAVVFDPGFALQLRHKASVSHIDKGFFDIDGYSHSQFVIRQQYRREDKKEE